MNAQAQQKPDYRSNEGRWNAVLKRDPHAKGVFYYAVKTTGIYCNPGCAARLPRRENVVFYANRDAAERAGFRPCKRCRPDAGCATDPHAAMIAKACRLIEHSAVAPNLDALAAATSMNRFYFHRVFKRVTGITPKAYAAARRAERVRKALRESPTVTTAIYDSGFNSSGRFYADANAALGMAPSHFRAGGKGETIRFAVGECSLGAVMVASTAKGVCAISLGDDPDALVRDLQDRFPKAALVGGDKAFERRIAVVAGFVDSPDLGLDLPLDVRGTAFQRRVWRALRAIPVGMTASYGEIAERIGAPHAARAVARACATNPIAVAIPCHRVVRRDGTAGGYRWGAERKRILLERETALVGHRGR